jgi:hypothetical protein
MLAEEKILEGLRYNMQKSSYPGSDFFLSRIRIKELKFFNPKKRLSSRKYDPGCSSLIWILTHPGSRGQKGTGSRIRIRNTAKKPRKIHVPIVYL